ncbi:MAG TPA: hypothetical protein VL354_03240, partial [Spirochaetia bacterium]|nr:hypothetical protein [Spirochaetia bacterium]
MAKRGRRRVFLGVQWDCDSWDTLPPLCDLIIDKVGKRPLVWNFPSPPPESLQRTREWLQKTIGPRLDLDSVAVMGFAGACHPVLTLDELDKEISWGIENPWGSGTAQLLTIRPEILIPRVADLLRPEAVAAYGRHGFKTLGIQGGRSMAWFAAGTIECFTCSRLS